MSEPLSRDQVDEIRKIAHKNTARCAGGSYIGGDGIKWHSTSCDRLFDDMVRLVNRFLCDVRI